MQRKDYHLDNRIVGMWFRIVHKVDILIFLSGHYREYGLCWGASGFCQDVPYTEVPTLCNLGNQE